MPRDIREYNRPADLAGALESLRHAQPLVLGPRIATDLYAGVKSVVDLSRLGLSYIKDDADLIRIGALTPLQALADSGLLQSLAGGILAQAALFSAGSALRQAATIGGAILGQHSSAEGWGPADTVLALLAFDAQLTIIDGADARPSVSVESYLNTAAPEERPELLLEISFVRPGQAAGAALVRLARTPRDQAIVAAVALYDGGQLRLALSGASPRPMRLRSVEQSLRGQAFTPARIDKIEADVAVEVEPLTDFRASAAYRRAMAAILARRAVEQAVAQSAA